MTVPQPYTSEGLINAYGFPVPYTRLFPAPIIAGRIPNDSTDLRYPIGQIWIYPIGGAAYILIANSGGTATWEAFAASTGDLFSLTGDSGTALPSSGNIKLAGTANQITTAASGSTVTFSVPSVFIAPGSIEATTTIKADTGLTVSAGGANITGTTVINTSGVAGTLIGNSSSTTSIVGTVNLNNAGAGVTTIGTGGTGAVNIGNATGNTAVTGSLTASTGLTTTTGNIAANNGSLVLGTAGNKLFITPGSNASIGTSAGMTSGTITISTTAVLSTSIIFLTANTLAGTPGTLSAPVGSIVNASHFVITSSSGSDASTVNWLIIN